MSIASEITRLQGVKSDILTAIGNKGVTIPAGSALDDCPGLIGDIGGYADGSSIISEVATTHPWANTPNFNISSANVVEENIVCKASAWPSGITYHGCGGQWYTGTSSYFNGVAVYIFADQIEFDYDANTEYHVTGISYDFSKWIRKNIVYDKIAGTATCRIYYDDVLVCTETIPLTNVRFADGIPYCIGGTRFNSSTTYSFMGAVDMSKSYIRIDGKLVWGCDS